MDTTFDTLAAIGPELTAEQLDDASGGWFPLLLLVLVAESGFLFGASLQ